MYSLAKADSSSYSRTTLTHKLTQLSTTKYSQTTIQDLRQIVQNPMQTAKNWDVILPSKNFLDKLSKNNIIDPNADQNDFIICLAYGGKNHSRFFDNLESDNPSRDTFFKTTETDGIDWVLYQIINNRLYKIKTILSCKPGSQAIFTGSIFDHAGDAFALVTIAFSKQKLIRDNGDLIPLQKQYLYKLLESGNFEMCKRRNGTKIESKPYCNKPFDWRDPNPVLSFISKPDDTIYFVGCGSDKNNKPCISNGKIIFSEGNNQIIRKLQPTTNLPDILFENQPLKTKYLECPQKIILTKSEVLLCSAGLDYNGTILHLMVGYIKNKWSERWQLINGTGIIKTNYPLGFGLYAAKYKIINNELVAIGWNSGPTGLPHSQSPYLSVRINEDLGTVELG